MESRQSRIQLWEGYSGDCCTEEQLGGRRESKVTEAKLRRKVLLAEAGRPSWRSYSLSFALKQVVRHPSAYYNAAIFFPVLFLGTPSSAGRVLAGTGIWCGLFSSEGRCCPKGMSSSGRSRQQISCGSCHSEALTLSCHCQHLLPLSFLLQLTAGMNQ